MEILMKIDEKQNNRKLTSKMKDWCIYGDAIGC